MANTIHRGERLAFVGTLTNGSQVTTDYGLVCQIFQMDKKIREFECSLDSTNNTYYGVIDTSNLLGPITIRFIARTAGGEIIVSNNDIQKTILQ